MLNAEKIAIETKKTRDIGSFIRLREALSTDLTEIGELLVKTFSQTYKAKMPHIHTCNERYEELRDVESRRAHGKVLVLELGRQIIGTVTLIYPNAKETQSWIRNAANLRCLAIDPGFHGLGFSEILLDECERLARSWNADFICLHTQSGALGVARLYTRKGYLREPSGDTLCFENESEGYYLPLYEIENKRGEA